MCRTLNETELCVRICYYVGRTFFFFFFKQKTAYEMRISDWSSDVCSSDLTELGRIELSPGQIALVPRGVRFRALLPDGSARGYVAENHGNLFRLPDLGPIGANGLANPRDFETPIAWFEDRDDPCEEIGRAHV